MWTIRWTVALWTSIEDNNWNSIWSMCQEKLNICILHRQAHDTCIKQQTHIYSIRRGVDTRLRVDEVDVAVVEGMVRMILDACLAGTRSCRSLPCVPASISEEDLAGEYLFKKNTWETSSYLHLTRKEKHEGIRYVCTSTARVRVVRDLHRLILMIKFSMTGFSWKWHPKNSCIYK